MMELSVIIPAYNEASRIRDSLNRIKNYLRTKQMNFEIIVVDDGSEDGTGRLVQEMIAGFSELKLIHLPFNRGKGFAVRAGMMEAKGKLILMSDADLSAPIEELEKLVQVIEQGADVAVGSRRAKGAVLLKHQSWFRQNIGLAFGFFTRIILPTGVLDTQCGFKCFKADVAKKLFSLQKSTGFAFDLEILALARKLGFGIKEVPVKWKNSESSKVKPFRHFPAVVKEVIKIRINLWREEKFGKG